jgi:hypothetical protein
MRSFLWLDEQVRGRAAAALPAIDGVEFIEFVDDPNQVGVHALQPITRWLAEAKGRSRLPHQADDHTRAGRGGVAGGALPISAGTSFQGRRKPNGSACHRRIMAGVQDAAKHAIRAMSPLKSWLVEKPQPNRKMLQAVLVAVFAAVLLATRLPSR